MRDTASMTLSLNSRDGKFETNADIIGDCKNSMTVTRTHLSLFEFFLFFSAYRLQNSTAEELQVGSVSVRPLTIPSG